MIYRTFLFVALLTSTFAGYSQKYKRIHAKAILVDTHNDFPSASIEKKVSFDADLLGKTHSDLVRMRQGGVDVQIFSIFCGPEQQHPYAFANREIDSVYEWVRRSPRRMALIKTPAELARAVKEKSLATMIGVEGGHMIEDKIENLDALYIRGARYMTLTWNNSTSWATSAADETAPASPSQRSPLDIPPPVEGASGDAVRRKGLTDFGKKVVERMNELGMIVDVSHVGEQTFWDVIKITTKPVIASHSNAWGLCPHRRNLKDDQIKAIAKSGGVIFLNFYAGFIDSTYERKRNVFAKQHQAEVDELIEQGKQKDYALMMVGDNYKNEINAMRPSLSALLDHLDYIVKLVGVDHVGLGSDFDGIEAPPLELNGVEDFPLITKALLERGYGKKDIKKILGENFLRVFEANMK
jgi:membrane dipeptidase